MKTTVHKAETRGHANHGWLDTHHTFSFAGYYNPERTRFGLLRVLNDDIVAAGQGFGEHPHDNMEIISIPLKGALAHRDSEGNEHVINAGDVQIMSAGTGLTHSEYNYSNKESVNFLQIWVFPKERDIRPRYEQKHFPKEERKNQWQTIVSPEKNEGIWINQDAYFFLGNLSEGKILNYSMRNPSHGAYLFIIEGGVVVDGKPLKGRDGMGITDTEQFTLEATKDAEILLMEIPMK